MSDEAIHLLAEKIRNSNPATTDPYDLYGWIANAIDLLNELYEDPPMNDVTPYEHAFPARPSAPVPEPLREEASPVGEAPRETVWSVEHLDALQDSVHEDVGNVRVANAFRSLGGAIERALRTEEARQTPSREETAEAVCETCGGTGIETEYVGDDIVGHIATQDRACSSCQARQESPASAPEETMRAVMRAIDGGSKASIIDALADHERARQLSAAMARLEAALSPSTEAPSEEK